MTMFYKPNGGKEIDGKLVDFAIFESEAEAREAGYLTHKEVWYPEEQTSQTVKKKQKADNGLDKT